VSFNTELEGRPVVGLSMLLPWRGVGSATAKLAGVVALEGPVTLRVGDVEFACTVVDCRSYALATTVELVLGGAGWRKLVAPRAHHNDATVLASTVATLLAAELGETIAVDAAVDAPIGAVDFVREAAEGARVLDQLFGGRWWVEADGTTRAGLRPSYAATSLLVLDVDARLQWADVSSSVVADCLPGVTFEDTRFSEPFTAHTSEIWIEGGALKARLWGGAREQNDLGELFAGLVRQALPAQRFTSGPYRYRVVERTGDRYALQPVNPSLGLPSLPLVGVSPGVAGASAELALSSVVYLDFVEGDPGLPLVRSLARRDEPGHVPGAVTIDADSILLGTSSTASYALRTGDLVQISGAVVAGVSGSVQGTITLNPAVMLAPGVPGTGRSKVEL
jgi:hypothetical protein